MDPNTGCYAFEYENGSIAFDLPCRYSKIPSVLKGPDALKETGTRPKLDAVREYFWFVQIAQNFEICCYP